MARVVMFSMSSSRWSKREEAWVSKSTAFRSRPPLERLHVTICRGLAGCVRAWAAWKPRIRNKCSFIIRVRRQLFPLPEGPKSQTTATGMPKTTENGASVSQLTPESFRPWVKVDPGAMDGHLMSTGSRCRSGSTSLNFSEPRVKP